MLEVTPPTLTLAVAQWDTQLGASTHNRQQSLLMIEEAAAQGAQLVLLPELCISGYRFNNLEEAIALAEPPLGPTELCWQEAAARHNIAVAGGLALSTQGTLTNSLICITPQGEITRYHKLHLFDREQLFFTPGEELMTWRWQDITFGLMICYDGWFPEVPRALVLAGAEVLLAPGCWHLRPDLAAGLSPALTLHLAAAYSNSAFVACASRTGSERDCIFGGGSSILGPHGLLVGPAPSDQDALLTTTIDLRQARFKYRTRRVHPIHNRRPLLYQTLVTPTSKAGS